MNSIPRVVVVSGTERTISAMQVRQLYDLVGWWPERTLPHLQAVLARGPVVGAWVADQLVGFARAVSDGYFRAYIEDVMVHPAYRRQGIGHTMMSRLLAELAEIETISLFCASALCPLYERSGFTGTSQRVMHRQQPGM